MKRSAKLFLQVDIDGYLIDTLAIIADVVNFDCYESVVSSCQRAIAIYQRIEPENVSLSRLYYYRKRMRSTRMNPVRIYNTTDVFRAIAEHPDGEIPLGVKWKIIAHAASDLEKGQQNKKSDNIEPRTRTENELAAKENKQKSTEQNGKKSAALRDEEKDPDYDPDNEFPNKKRKREITQIYKTYMPPNTQSISSITMNMPDSSSKPPGAGQTYVSDHKANPQIRNITLDSRPFTTPSPDPLKTYSESSTQSKYYSEKRDTKVYSRMSEYQWPEESHCEIVMSYGGISERQALPVSLAINILNMVKEHFTQNPLSKPKSDTKKMNTSGPSQTMLDDLNTTIKEEFKNIRQPPRRPIKYLHDAKMEIFKVLSMLNLSKARFENLLDWIKSLKLQEGKHGKFVLSERRKVGKVLKVHYDTDQEAAIKLNQIYRARISPRINLNQGKVLYPVDMMSNLVTGKTPQDPAAKPPKPMILLMPGVSGSMLPLSGTNTSSVTLISQSTTSTVRSLNTTPVPRVVSAPTNPVSTSNIPSERSKTPEQDESAIRGSSKRKQPSILRRKLPAPVQKVVEPIAEKTPVPIPMHLYRSYKAGNEAENMKLASYNQDMPMIKTEPVSFSDNEIKVEEGSEYSSSKDPGDESNEYEHLKQVLKSDVVLPQGPDDKQFEIVMVKSEPLDDY